MLGKINQVFPAAIIQVRKDKHNDLQIKCSFLSLELRTRVLSGNVGRYLRIHLCWIGGLVRASKISQNVLTIFKLAFSFFSIYLFSVNL